MDVETYVQSNLEYYIQEGIFPVIKLEAVSEHKKPAQMRPVAEKVKEIMHTFGVERLQILQEANSYPAVYGEVRSTHANAPTILIQGHYDGQPSDASKWIKTKPHQPKVIFEHGEHRIYGRGASDDWGQVFTHIAAVDAHTQTAKAIPAHIKFLIEGGEEQGSRDLDKLVAKYKHLLQCDVVMITDSAPGRMGHPVITTLARGLAAANITYRVGNDAAHSGDNIAPNAVAELSAILGSMKDYRTGRIQIPGFYDHVSEFSAADRKKFNDMPFDVELFQRTYGLSRIVMEEGYTPQETMWLRPSFEVHTVQGGEFSNNIPYEAKAYVTMRVPPGADPLKLFELFRQDFYRRTAELKIPASQLQFENEHFGHPFTTTTDHPYFRAAERAMEKAFGASVDFMGCGGTEPIAVFHQQILKVPIIFNAYNSPQDHYHGNEESFSIEKGLLPGIMANLLFYKNMIEV